jgi:dimethylhistidine N-methyltransferase
MKLSQEIEVIDQDSQSSNFLTEVLVGLSKGQKTIPPKYLYDEKGSQIFQKICELEEYYPTQAEKEILQNHGEEMASLIGPEALIIEPGSGDSAKVKSILDHLESPVAYVPLEISREILLEATKDLHESYPELRVIPVCGDFTSRMELPISVSYERGKKVVFFPGSTIGNLNPSEALDLLKWFGKLIKPQGGLLIGVDLKKEKEVIELAYDDPKGVTAEFNLNLLSRLNREVNASFDLSRFTHRAFYNEEKGRVEMHLMSNVSQLVRVNQTVFRFLEGETIHTENSYKYSVEEFTELCAKARFVLKKFWHDQRRLFTVYYFERE